MKSGAPFTPKTSCRSIVLLPLPQMDCASRYAQHRGNGAPQLVLGVYPCARGGRLSPSS